MSLNKDIQDLISKSLPELEAKNLRDYINQAEEDKIKIKQLEELRVIDSNTMVSMQDKLTKLERLSLDERTIDENRNKLANEKMEFEVLKVKQELQYEKDSNAKIFSLVDKIFSNNTIKKIVTESVAIPIDGGNNPGYIQRENNIKTEVIEG